MNNIPFFETRLFSATAVLFVVVLFSTNNKITGAALPHPDQLINDSSIVEVVTLIRDGNTETARDKFIELGNKYNDISSDSKLDDIIPELVSVTYAGSIVNVDNLLKFFVSLPNYSSVGIGLPAVYAEMQKMGDDKNYPDLFKFAYRVKELLDKLGDNNDEESVKMRDIFTRLKNVLPVVVQKLVWGEVCTIKNVLYGEYLYQANDAFQLETGERRIFTWIPQNWNPKDLFYTEGSWRFYAMDEGRRYQIKNVFWESKGEKNINLVMNTGDRFDDSRNNIVSTKDASAYKSDAWNLEPLELQDAKGIFFLRSSWGNHFLYAANSTFKYDNDRRRVFNLVGTRAVPAGAEWEIDCS